jgi:hypothetical protein
MPAFIELIMEIFDKGSHVLPAVNNRFAVSGHQLLPTGFSCTRPPFLLAPPIHPMFQLCW